jgi:hypothetical protein
VKNNGWATAYNCKAKLTVTEGTSQVRPHDTKRLIWDDNSESVTISPKKDNELLHIAFSDSNFGLNQNQIFAMISSFLDTIFFCPFSYRFLWDIRNGSHDVLVRLFIRAL